MFFARASTDNLPTGVFLFSMLTLFFFYLLCWSDCVFMCFYRLSQDGENSRSQRWSLTEKSDNEVSWLLVVCFSKICLVFDVTN